MINKLRESISSPWKNRAQQETKELCEKAANVIDGLYENATDETGLKIDEPYSLKIDFVKRKSRESGEACYYFGGVKVVKKVQ